MRGLHGPHTPPKPVHQREIVGVSAEERLTEMDVGLDQAWKDVASARLNDSIVRFFDGGGDCRNTAVTDRDVTIDDVETVVHGHHDAATDEQRHRKCQTRALRFEGSQRIESSAASRLAILPCFTAMSSARMLTAIS